MNTIDQYFPKQLVLTIILYEVFNLKMTYRVGTCILILLEHSHLLLASAMKKQELISTSLYMEAVSSQKKLLNSVPN